MATTIKATCSQEHGGAGCGDVRLSSDQVVLRKLFEDATQSSYRFTCPICHKIVVKPASIRIADLLAESDVRIEIWELPLELMERPDPGEGTVITEDDIIDLGLAFERDEEDCIRRIIYKNIGDS